MSSLKNICVLSYSKEADQVAGRVREIIERHGSHITPKDKLESADLLVVIGGDGSMLHHAKIAHKHQIPILGVNLGRVGFLADIELEDEEVIHSILSGHYIEDNRKVLKCRANGKIHYALNEFMINKSKPSRMIRYEVFVDDRFLYDQTADGLIIATPTGSSAYALSAGGQLIHPEVSAMTLVPVSPSRLSSRPIIIPDSSEVEVLVHPWKDGSAIFSVDALDFSEEVSRFHISIDENPVTLLHPLHYDYYRTLQDKLNWETRSISDRTQRSE